MYLHPPLQKYLCRLKPLSHIHELVTRSQDDSKKNVKIAFWRDVDSHSPESAVILAKADKKAYVVAYLSGTSQDFHKSGCSQRKNQPLWSWNNTANSRQTRGWRGKSKVNTRCFKAEHRTSPRWTRGRHEWRVALELAWSRLARWSRCCLAKIKKFKSQEFWQMEPNARRLALFSTVVSEPWRIRVCVTGLRF